jgi:hypothetical protein
LVVKGRSVISSGIRKKQEIIKGKYHEERSLRNTESLFETLEIAEKLGFRSVHQLKIFVIHANNEGKSISELSGHKVGSLAYVRHVGCLRKLMRGSPDRGSDGMKILIYSGKVDDSNLNENGIKLTPKGKRWAKKLDLCKS